MTVLKLLFLTREPFPSFRPDIAALFGRCLPARGVYSDIVAMADSDREWPAGRTFTIKVRGKASRAIARIALALKLFGLARGDYAAIQVRDRVLGGLLGLMAARFANKPFYFWMSFPFPEAWLDTESGTGRLSLRLFAWRFRGAIAYFVLYRLVARYADHVFVQSEAMREALASKGVSRHRMTAVPMGVEIPPDLDQIVPCDDARLKGRRVIAYLGALERIRRPEIMVDAMHQVVARYPDSLLVLVGDSQTAGDRDWLEAHIARSGLSEHVLITGWLPSEKAWRYLRAAEMGLSPFPRTRVLEVASPTKVCEYLAYGIPVVANDQPDQAWLLELTGGGLCVDLSAGGFADGILELLRDPLRAAQMAARGRARVAELRAYPVIADHVASVYHELDRARRIR